MRTTDQTRRAEKPHKPFQGGHLLQLETFEFRDGAEGVHELGKAVGLEAGEEDAQVLGPLAVQQRLLHHLGL